MARIPVTQEPSVRTEGLPTPYARPFATPQGQGADFGNVLEGAAHVASQFEQDARDRANIAATDGAWGDGKQVLNIKVKDPDPNGVGYARLNGKDAMDARTQTVETVNKSLDEVNAKLTPEQQRMFAPRLQSLKEEAFNHIISHESAQQNRYAQQLFKGTSDSIMQEMQMPDALGNPEQLAQKRRDLMQVGINRAKELLGKNASAEAIKSVVVPDMQAAALGTMQAALQQAQDAGDPTIAENAFKVLEPDLLTSHKKQIGGMVQALSAKAAISKGSQAVIGGATDSVALPDGGVVARVDGGKVAAGVANLKDDMPHLAEIQDAAEKRQARLGKVWTSAVVTVTDRAESAAQKGGGFDLERASAVDIEWLRVNAPRELERLQSLDNRGTRATSAKASHDAYSGLMFDMDANKRAYRDLSVPEFAQHARDRGVEGTDLDKARQHFDSLQKGALSEKINSTVAKELRAAFTDDKTTQAALQGDLLDAAQDFAERWSTATKGQVVPEDKLRQFIRAELVTGKVADTGIYWDRRTRLEYQRNPDYAGKAFEPLDFKAPTIPEPPKQSAANAPRAAIPVQAATPVAPAPRAVPAPPTGKVNVFDKDGNWAGTIPDTPAQRKAAQNAGLKI